MNGSTRHSPGWLMLVICGVLGGSVAKGQDAFTARPTVEHKLLAKDVGVWDATVKLYVQGPDAEPLVSQAVETNTLLGDGLWLISTFEGDFAGQPFEGRGVTGYDPDKKKYVGTWVDSMSPSVLLPEGTYEEASKTLTMIAEGKDAMSGESYTSKMVLTYDSDTQRSFTMYMAMPATGDEFVKSMEIQYQRRSK